MGRGREKEKQAGELGKLHCTSVRPGWPGTARLRPPAGLERRSRGSRLLLAFPSGRRPRSRGDRDASAGDGEGARARGETIWGLGVREAPGPVPGAAAPRARPLSPGDTSRPEGLKRRAGEPSSRRRASWAPSPSCLFHDASEENSEKFAKCGAARRALEPGPGVGC